MTAEFRGTWVRRGGVLVPVMPDSPPKIVCKVCGGPSPTALCRSCRESVRERVHGSHAGYAQHARRNEPPCQACRDAERVYQGKRYRRGQLSKTDRLWCEKQAAKWEQFMFERTNRMLG